MLMLALPGSAYLYQGEELGLHEVADLPAQALQDPIWQRTLNTKKGRDGCRVPLPWTDEGHSYGFGDSHAWLPQPAGFSRTAVAAQSGRPESTLELYREALRIRRQLQTAEALEWVPTDNPRRAALRAPRRLALHQQLRHRAGDPAGRGRPAEQRSG